LNQGTLDRRDLLKILGTALGPNLVSAQEHHGANQEAFQIPANYEPRFFSAAEYKTISELCAIIIPSDADSPGAREAGVPWFIDTVMFYSDTTRQGIWWSGLKSIDALSMSLHGSSFLACSPEQRVQTIESLAREEDLTLPSDTSFFGELKATTIEAFCLSDAGMRDYLRYRGNTVLLKFPGCSHENS
jgi:gluconate 2-dehydrogenase subunit 3-like protein